MAIRVITKAGQELTAEIDAVFQAHNRNKEIGRFQYNENFEIQKKLGSNDTLVLNTGAMLVQGVIIENDTILDIETSGAINGRNYVNVVVDYIADVPTVKFEISGTFESGASNILESNNYKVSIASFSYDTINFITNLENSIGEFPKNGEVFDFEITPIGDGETATLNTSYFKKFKTFELLKSNGGYVYSLGVYDCNTFLNYAAGTSFGGGNFIPNNTQQMFLSVKISKQNHNSNTLDLLINNYWLTNKDNGSTEMSGTVVAPDYAKINIVRFR